MNDETANKFTKIIGSFGMSAGIIELIVPLALRGTEPIVLISIMLGGIVALWPITYVVANKIIKRREVKDEKAWRCVTNVFATNRELEEKDKTYCQTTTNFLQKIYQKEKETGLMYASNLCININSLLYLINANYYDEIVKYLKKIKREELIDMLLEQIFLYLKDTKAPTLTNKDVEAILKNCYFLKDDLKKKIKNEYQESEVNFNGFIDHGIVNRKIDTMNEKEYEAVHQAEIPETTTFDIENTASYKIIVEGMLQLDDYLCYYGDTTIIEWDYEALQKVVCLIARDFRKELIKQIDDYTEFDLTASLAHHALAYATLNKKSRISYQELLNTFKDWDYISYDLRCTIAEYLINKLEMSKEDYPLNIKKSSYSKRKIIDINQFKQRK